jgi:hypothetical protein
MALVRLRVNRQKELIMNVLKQEKKLAVLAALAEGNSLRWFSPYHSGHASRFNRSYLVFRGNCSIKFFLIIIFKVVFSKY